MADSESNENSISSVFTEQDELFDYILDEDEAKIEDMLNKKRLPIWEYKNRDSHNSSVLNISAYKGNYRITQILIDYCKKYNNDNLEQFINEENDQGITPIHYASFRGDINIIKLLIENGADFRKKTKRELNVIHYCAQSNKPNSLLYFYFLCKKNANLSGDKYDLITEKDKGGSTPLHWAVYSSAEDFLLFLIHLNVFKTKEARLNFINQKDYQENTPLHLCITSKSSRIALKLLQNGADPNIRDRKGNTPLQLAIDKKQDEIKKVLENNQSCQLCMFNVPAKQIKKSKMNIICLFSSLIITNIILFCFTFPIALKFVKGDINQNLLFFGYIAFLLLFILFYIILLSLDPGLREKNNLHDLEKVIDENNDLTKYCYKCYIEKTKTSKHCVICDNCYEDFDHHCFWINKCVAKNNYYCFLIFLYIAFIYLAIFLLITILTLLDLFFSDDNNYCDEDSCFLLKIGFYESICKFFLGKDKFFYKIRYIIGVLLMIIILCFIIPESFLLYLHMHVCCSNYREEKRQRRNRRLHPSAFSASSMMSEDDNALLNPSGKKSLA